MKWAPTTVQLYGRQDEIIVVDDFHYAMSRVTHPNGYNDSNFPPLLCNASLLSLSRRLQWMFLSSSFATPIFSLSMSPQLL